MKEYHITIPKRFALDREGRDLSNGNGEWTKQGYKTVMNQEQFDDLNSDASYYCDSTGGPDMIDIGLRSSAQATVKRIKAILG